jgi:hypothetical protein
MQTHENPEERMSQIAARAYERFLARGGEHGHDVEDWLAAEAEVSRTMYEAVLVDPGPNTIELVRALRELTGRSLAELRLALDTPPCLIARAPYSKVEAVRSVVERLQGRVELRPVR